MKSLYVVSILLCLALVSAGQIMPLTLEPSGGNKKASVSEQVGIVTIAINYSRPGVKGREGKIWNTPVAHYGFKDLGHGTSNAAPWRAGANENTTISFSHPVKVEGKDIPAGTYGFFIALDENESTLIFSKVSTSWGSFYYDPAEDALRVTVKNQTLEKSAEWLTYKFIDQSDDGVTIAMSWEKRMIPFRVEVARKELQMAAFRNDLRTTRPYYDFMSAAYWCIQNDYELEQALAWMDRAIYFRIMGEKNFRTLNTKAAILLKMNRAEEAKKVMAEAVPLGSMVDVHSYGRQLIAMNEVDEAYNIFKSNYAKFPNEFTTNIGMGRGLSAKGEYKKALKYIKAALPQAPDDRNKTSAIEMIAKLERNEDIN